MYVKEKQSWCVGSWMKVIFNYKESTLDKVIVLKYLSDANQMKHEHDCLMKRYRLYVLLRTRRNANYYSTAQSVGAVEYIDGISAQE